MNLDKRQRNITMLFNFQGMFWLGTQIISRSDYHNIRIYKNITLSIEYID